MQYGQVLAESPIVQRALCATDLLYRLEGEPCTCTRRGAAA
jgi:hypothetical protein